MRSLTSGLSTAIVLALSVVLAGPATAATSSEETTAATVLADLVVSAEGDQGLHDFPRSLFDRDGDGCTTVHDIAIEESVIPASVTQPGCRVVGEWFSYYDGLTWTDPREVYMALVVPEDEAWQSGADAWTWEQRIAYYDEVEFPLTRQAISRTLDDTKGAADPAGWLPPLAQAHCRYAVSWVLIKHRWSLSVDPAERQALDAIFADEGCGDTVVTRPGTGLVVAPVPPVPVNELPAGATLRAGDDLTSLDGRYRAIMQGDGNFVVYSPTRAVWSSRTGGNPGAVLVMQADGNLVVYSKAGAPLFATRTSGGAGSRLVVQDNGVLVVYGGSRAQWSTEPDHGAPSPPTSSRDTLAADQQLTARQEITSRNKAYRFVMQADGNAVVYTGSYAVWSTRTGTPGARLTLQADGNLVVYTGLTPLWHARTDAGARLVMQDDGNLVLYSATNRPVWNSNDDRPPPAPPAPSGDTLQPGQSLAAGQALSSPNSAFRLVMQGDGNLVVYGLTRPVWASRTGSPGSRVTMQTDGNLVVYSPRNTALFSTGTDGRGARLVIQSDGNLVVYAGNLPRWNTGGETGGGPQPGG